MKQTQGTRQNQRERGGVLGLGLREIGGRKESRERRSGSPRNTIPIGDDSADSQEKKEEVTAAPR